jgi:hypothetical protein
LIQLRSFLSFLSITLLNIPIHSLFTQFENMHFSALTLLALGTAGVSSSAVHRRGLGLQTRQQEAAQGFVGANSGGGAQCLTSDLIQSASDKTGQEPGTDGIKAGQAPSAT